MQSKLSSKIEGNNFQLVWRDVKFTARSGTKDERVIVNNVCGTIQSGQIMAFLGPSGSGKTTVLECIIGKRKIGFTGQVEVRLNENYDSEKVNVAFIPQKDHLLNQLTVRESILFSTKIQISKKIYEKQRLDPIIDKKTNKKYFPNDSKYCDVMCSNIINDLNLEVCEFNRIGSCSGGQIKRISIAQELASRPRIIFLDEATSGLDSNSSYSLIKLLSGLTKGSTKIAIIISIHQPSVKLFNSFDLIYVLSKGGTCIFQGQATEVVPYLSRFGLNCPEFYNAADYVIEVANLDYGEEHIPRLAMAHLEIFTNNTSNLDKTNITYLIDLFEKNEFPEFQHSYQLMLRSLLVTLRDPLVFLLRFTSHIFMAYFFAEFFGRDLGIRGGCSPEVGDFDPKKLDYVTDQIEKEVKNAYNNVASFFYLIVFTAFSAIMPICIAFPSEMEVLTREYNNAWYTLRSYYLGKTLSEIPFQLIMPTMLALFFFNLSNQEFTYWRICNFTGLTVLSTFVAQSFGYFIGAVLMENISASLFFGPLSCFPIMAMSGFFVKMKNIPEIYRPLTYLSYIKHATNGLIISVYGFERCGNSTNQILKDNKEQFQIWLGGMLGLYGETETTINLNANTTVDPFYQLPTEKFVEDIVNTITDPFISKITNKTQSLAMNEFDLIDSDILICWICLIIYLLVTRTIVYYTIRFKAQTYAY